MTWLAIIILAYFFLAVVSSIDKFLLKKTIFNPKVYSFYVGIAGISVLFLTPFVNFSIPDFGKILLSFLYGAFFILAFFWYCKALYLFEASRIVPAIGALIPLCVFILTFLSGERVFNFRYGLAFLLLILGGIFITLEAKKLVTLKSLQISAVSAFLFSLAFFLSKILYSQQSFWTAFIWMRIGVFLSALLFLLSSEVKEELFKKRAILKRETAGIFILGLSIGAIFFILQNWAIFLVPFGLLAFIHALEGITYVFLLIFTVFLSLKFPQIIKEEISKKILFQKISAISLIMAGLALLAF